MRDIYLRGLTVLHIYMQYDPSDDFSYCAGVVSAILTNHSLFDSANNRLSIYLQFKFYTFFTKYVHALKVKLHIYMQFKTCLDIYNNEKYCNSNRSTNPKLQSILQYLKTLQYGLQYRVILQFLLQYFSPLPI